MKINQIRVFVWRIYGEKRGQEWVESQQAAGEFGHFLEKLVIQNLRPGLIRNKRQAALQLAGQLNMDISAIYRWLRGDLSGKKPLTVETLRRIIDLYLGLPGLGTQALLEYWLALGPQNYHVLLEDPEVLRILRQRRIPAGPDWREDGLVTRSGIEQAVRTQLQHSTTRFVVLKGPPGVGKTCLLEKVYKAPWAHSAYRDVIWLNDAHDMQMEKWFEQIAKQVNLECTFRDYDSLALVLRQRCWTQQSLLCVDNLLYPKRLKALQHIFGTRALVLAATRHQESLLDLPFGNIVIDVGGYTWDEIVQSAHRHEVPLNDEYMLHLAECLDYNPQEVNHALALVRRTGWQAVLCLLTQPPPVEPVGVERYLFRSLYLAYEMLEGGLKTAFRKLGALPLLADYDLNILSSVWGVPQARAAGWASQLANDAGLLQPVRQGRWRISRRVWHYAHALFEQLDETTKRQPCRWTDRAIQLPTIRSWYADECARCSGPAGPDMEPSLAPWYLRWTLKSVFMFWACSCPFWEVMGKDLAKVGGCEYTKFLFLFKREQSWIALLRCVCLGLLFLPAAAIVGYWSPAMWLAASVLLAALVHCLLESRRFLRIWKVLLGNAAPDEHKKDSV
jgi:hypothetical protein